MTTTNPLPAAELSLLCRLNERDPRPTARMRASRAASTLYALGLATNPDATRWCLTAAGAAVASARADRS